MSREVYEQSRLWTNDVGPDGRAAATSCQAQTAVLQYSIEENLRPKLDFFAVNWRFQRLI
jgi:hypothetical protein